MGNFGFSAELPWASKADDAICFDCKECNDNLYHFLFDCPYFRDNFDSLWSNLVIKATNCNFADGSHVSSFLTNLDQHNKALMLVECLPLPFDSLTVTVLTRFVASAVGKIYMLRTERLRELEAPWLRKQLNSFTFSGFNCAGFVLLYWLFLFLQLYFILCNFFTLLT